MPLAITPPSLSPRSSLAVHGSENRRVPRLRHRSRQGAEARRSRRARQHAVANDRGGKGEGPNRITQIEPAHESGVQQFFQAPLLNRFFRALRTAGQPLLDLSRNQCMRHTRTLYLDGKIRTWARRAVVFAEGSQGHHGSFVERLGTDVNWNSDSICRQRSTICLPLARAASARRRSSAGQ